MPFIIAFLALIGAWVAGYLTLAHGNVLRWVCGGPGWDCLTVASHPMARGFGIPGLEWVPTAFLGVLGFAGILALSLWISLSHDHQRRRGLVRAGMWLVGSMVLASLVLTFTEWRIIRAWCLWCVASAVITGLIAWLWTVGVWRGVSSAPSGPLYSLRTTRVALGGLGLLLILGAAVLYGIPGGDPAPVRITDRVLVRQLVSRAYVVTDGQLPQLLELGDYRCQACKTSERTLRSIANRAGVRRLFLPAVIDSADGPGLGAEIALAANELHTYSAIHMSLLRECTESTHDLDRLLNAISRSGYGDVTSLRAVIDRNRVAGTPIGFVPSTIGLTIVGLPAVLIIDETDHATMCFSIEQVKHAMASKAVVVGKPTSHD